MDNRVRRANSRRVPSIERLTSAPLVFTAGSWDDAPRVDRSDPTDVRHMLS
jgi:hypothetical protein